MAIFGRFLRFLDHVNLDFRAIFPCLRSDFYESIDERSTVDQPTLIFSEKLGKLTIISWPKV